MPVGVYERTDEHKKNMSESAIRRCTPEWRKQRSAEMKGKQPAITGKHHSEESLQKMRKPRPSMRGKNNPMKRLENKKKLRETIANNGGRVGSHNHNWKGDKAKIHKSGFTLGDYKKMAKEQNEVCAICGGKETRKKSDGKVCRLMIDHDHKTNKVRGLLCHNCNVGLGHFLDNVEFLLKAIKYIKER